MELSKDRVIANLRRMGQGIDEKNPAHVSAYMLCRQTNHRVRPEHILAAAATMTLSSASSVKLTSDFYLVDKSSLSNEPQWLIDFRVSEEDLRYGNEVPVDTNFDAFWILDGSCPRESLPKASKRIAFVESLTRTMKGERGSSAAEAPDAAPASLVFPSAAAAPVLTSAAAAPATQLWRLRHSSVWAT
jgi:hypothetical protein